MKFQDIPNEITEKALSILDKHLEISTSNLLKDKCILPMLMTISKNPNYNNIMSLLPQNGQVDVDLALSKAIKELKKIDFEYALFSYSTKIGLRNGNLTNALKTYIFVKNGLTMVFFTPYKISGFIKKKVNYEKSIIGEIVDNIFEQVN